MTEDRAEQHLGAELLQAFLDGELPERERAGVEEHLGTCAPCSADLEEWRALFSELTLPELAPGAGFSTRVLDGVHAPERLPLAARVRARIGAWLPGTGARERHIPAGRLQDLVEGLLGARSAARVEAHLEACAPCARQAEAWRDVFRRLGSLERLSPSDGFSAAVLARISVRAPAAAPSRVRWLDRALAAARSVLPKTRRAWATLSGVAVTPAVTVGLALYVVFSHPTLTPGALISFTWWKASALAGAIWSTVVQAALESSQLFQVYSFAEALSAQRGAVVALALAYSLGCALALRVLYKNLFASRTADRHGYATVSAS